MNASENNMDNAEFLINKYLDEIDEVYTSERKQKILSRMEGFWKGEDANDRIPYSALHLEGLKDLNDEDDIETAGGEMVAGAFVTPWQEVFLWYIIGQPLYI